MSCHADDVVPGHSIVGVELAGRSDLVVLTYDDGPQRGATDVILDALDEHGATATFFMLVGRARRESRLVREVLQRGHEVALHGADHRRLSQVPPDTLVEVLRGAKIELEALVDRPVKWFRPPYGDQTASTWMAVVLAGLVPVMWTAEARDWADVPVGERVAAACSVATPGGIVLCHDGFPNGGDGVPGASPPPPFDRGDLARVILRTYRERGLRATSLGTAAEQGMLVGRTWLNRCNA